MKMRHLIRIVSKKWFYLFFLITFPFSASVVTAQNKVVIIPLLDEKSEPPGPIPKRGQTTSYATGDDGDLEKGEAWPVPRFTINDDDTVTDNLTGLIWLRDGNCMMSNYPEFDNDESAGDGSVTWLHALEFIAKINDGTYSDCGAGYTDWRLPNIREILSLIHYGVYDPAVPNTSGIGKWSAGDPFTGLLYQYWTSTTFAHDTDYAHILVTETGTIAQFQKDWFPPMVHVWCVRGGL